jgi:hypothetical protein
LREGYFLRDLDLPDGFAFIMCRRPNQQPAAHPTKNAANKRMIVCIVKLIIEPSGRAIALPACKFYFLMEAHPTTKPMPNVRIR